MGAVAETLCRSAGGDWPHRCEVPPGGFAPIGLPSGLAETLCRFPTVYGCRGPPSPPHLLEPSSPDLDVGIAVGDLTELALPGSVRRDRVQALSMVHREDVSSLEPTAGARLTLLTCYPFYFVGPAPERFIVRAELMSPTSPRRDSPAARR